VTSRAEGAPRASAYECFALQNLGAGGIHFRRAGSIFQGSRNGAAVLGNTQKQLDELHIALVPVEE